jgi:DNA-binding response OmpR family regulator
MKKILIIDDEEGFCELVKEHLEMGGDYSVVAERSGRKALQTAEELRPDLILLDVMMPDANGIDVLRKLKESRKTVAIPVIMLTAVGDSATKTVASRLYDEDYITKPVKLAVLRDRIDAILSRSGE